MILVGYQGIGKSTLCYHNKDCLDLESSKFFVRDHLGNRVRPADWYVMYCETAINLSRQGYTVCISSHKEVRQYLIKNYSNHDLRVCYPCLDLKTEWIKKLTNRYSYDPTEKNLKAYLNAVNMYDESIRDLSKEPVFKHLVIKDMSYDLSQLVEESN